MRPLLLSLSLLPLVLTGCSLSPTSGPAAVPGVALSGRLHGGQQPVSGAKVYLLAANTTGYGQASVSLLKASATGNTADSIGSYVLTGADGSWGISGDYSCPSQTTQVYLYGLGGNAGSGVNSGAGFLAALGNCGGLASIPYVWVDEVSTIAAAYSFAGYATDATHVSSPNTTLGLAGIANAFANAANLVNVATGQALATTPAGNATVPQAEIYALADVLGACVNSAGPGAGSNCTLLFASAKSAGTSGTTPTDTATVAINIAHNPGSNVSTLYALIPATPAFADGNYAQPNDFTVALTYTGGGLNKPEAVAIDASGNAWVANYGSTGVSEILSGGAFAANSPFSGGGLNIAEAIAIDASGNAWVANTTKNSLSEFKGSDGSALSGSSGYTGGGLNAPAALAVDANGYVWAGNSTKNTCVSEFNGSTGVAVAGYTIAGCSATYGLAIDGSGTVWSASNDSSALVGIFGSGSSAPGTLFHRGGAGGISSPDGVAINNVGNIWVANGAKNSTSISEFVAAGTAASGSTGDTGGGVQTPSAIAVDGSGNVWVANSGGPSISEFSSGALALSPPASSSFNGGYASSYLSNPYSIAVDGSGNVWVADEGNNAVIEVLGIATPVVTPLVASLKSPYSVPGSEP